jgi:uncharacterized repeat protein (TIGR01451 family)
VVNPDRNPEVRWAGPSETDHQVTIYIPDMDPTVSGPRAGVQEGIASGAEVTVIISQPAGIRNPDAAGDYPVTVQTNPAGNAATNVSVTPVPNTAGLTAEFRITFTTSADIPANAGSIVITFDEDYLFPSEAATPPPPADLSVRSADFPDSAFPGDRFTYQVMVASSGAGAATGVRLTESLASGLSLESVTSSRGSCSQANGLVDCSLGSLAPTEVIVITFQVRVLSTAQGVLTVTASLGGDAADPVPANNQLLRRLNVTPRPTDTPPPAPTPAPTSTPLPPPTSTPEPAPTATVAPQPTPTAPPLPTNTAVPSATPTPAITIPAPTPVPTVNPTIAPTTPQPTQTPTPSETGGCSLSSADAGVVEGGWALLLLALLGLALAGRRPRRG